MENAFRLPIITTADDMVLQVLLLLPCLVYSTKYHACNVAPSTQLTALRNMTVENGLVQDALPELFSLKVLFRGKG